MLEMLLMASLINHVCINNNLCEGSHNRLTKQIRELALRTSMLERLLIAPLINGVCICGQLCMAS